MIKVNDLCKTIDGKVILDHVSLTIEKGSIYGIIGPNGAGKTTLIRHMISSYLPDSGEILFEGQPILDNVAMKSRMVYIPDEFPTTFGSNVREIALFYSHVYPTWNEARFQELLVALNQNQLSNFNQFSKGMKKQVLFILALSIMPDYLIMDEPFDGLDPLVQKKIWDYLISDVQKRQMTIFISSHHLKELDTMCDYVCLLDKGKVMFEYKMEDLKKNVHKIQIAFHSDLMQDKAKSMVTLLGQSTIGKIHTWIVEGNIDDIMSRLEDSHPLLLEEIPLDLEEIFTHALGGEKNEVTKVFPKLFE